MDSIIRNFHGYKQTSNYKGRSINYLIYDQYNEPIGSIGFGSSFFCTTARDRFIGWGANARWQNLQNIANNWRFTIKPNPYKNIATKVLSVVEKQIQIDWYEKYGDKLYMLDTYVEPPRTGVIYKANGWTMVGRTIGDDFGKRGTGTLGESLKSCENLGKNKVIRKLVFVKPLHRYWKRRLKRYVDKRLLDFYNKYRDKIPDSEIDKIIKEHKGAVSELGAVKLWVFRNNISVEQVLKKVL